MLQVSCALFLSLLISTESVQLPAVFQKCNRNQTDLDSCLVKAANDGLQKLLRVTEIKMPKLDPLEVPQATIKGSGNVAVDQHFKNCKLYGLLDNTKFTEFSFDKNNTLRTKLVFHEIKKQCEYEFDGRVLLLPIKGKGPSTVILRQVRATIVFKFEELKKRGKTFVKLTHSDVEVDIDGSIHFNFENLFDGDKALGDNINKVLNDNWKEVWGDLKSGYIEIINQVLLNIFDRFFSQVSLEEALD